jgi:methionine-rich copper-binding protein CopC
MSDAGEYFAVVTNPFPSSATSRAARLTVTADTFAPAVLSVAGTPNKITINFSEPVTPASAIALTNYSPAGLSITGAAADPNDASVVVLNTDAQTLGATYILTLNNILDRFNNRIASNTRLTFKSSIVIDGSFDDWAGVPPAFSDPQDSTQSLDYKDVYITNDDDFVYVRLTLWAPGDFGDYHNNLFIDADNDATTGYSIGGIGSDLLVQSGGGYEEQAGVFNNGTVSGLDWLMAPSGVGTNIEFRLSRHAIYDNTQLPVFNTNMITIVLEADNAGGNTAETAPDIGGYVYTFAAPTQLGPLAVSINLGVVTISWTGQGLLQSRQSLTTDSWQTVLNAPNPYTVQATNTQSYYRLIR